MSTLIWAIVVLGALAIIFGLILAVAAKVFEVEVDPRLPEIQACLAGANCGGCGYPGCGGCAEAILAGKAPVTACAPAGWTCPAQYYGATDGCDCGCGILDPDCATATIDACQYCNDSGSCSTVAGCPGTISPDDISTCT